MQLEQVLAAAVRGGASDVIIKTGSTPHFRFQGQLVALSGGVTVTSELILTWIKSMLPAFDGVVAMKDLDFAFQNKTGHRFRVNVFRQRGELAMVLRVVLGHIRTMEELQLPEVLNKFVDAKRGLLLVTGATGSGKSTTMAAILDKINRSKSAHIITIEDPIEYLFQDASSVIEQREVGIDVSNFPLAVKSALRQNPDVIMIGELRDIETVKTAIQAAETGHLVISTLHTNNAVEAIHRLLSFFDPTGMKAAQESLAQILVGIVSQRLVKRKNSAGMIGALEVLVNSPLVKDVIDEGNLTKLHAIISEGQDAWGMQSFDQALAQLVEKGLISQEEARKNASSASNLDLKMAGIS